MADKITLPQVSRVSGTLIANEIVSVQPMSAPSWLLFYLDYQYGNKNCPLKIGGSVILKGESND